MLLACACIVGAVVGSFVNVCIWRLPAGESIVSPPSHCPHCGNHIRAYDNIPILSYLLLGGRCRACRTRISARYPAVEALTAAGFALVAHQFGPTPEAAAAALFLAALIVISFIDLDHQIIPDVISLRGSSSGCCSPSPGSGRPGATASSASSSVAGPCGPSPPAMSADRPRGDGRRRHQVAGDGRRVHRLARRHRHPHDRLVHRCGVGLALMIARGADSRLPIPFGPFLAFGAACGLFFGDSAVNWYLGLALL